jgi:hypothetical protein
MVLRLGSALKLHLSCPTPGSWYLPTFTITALTHLWTRLPSKILEHLFSLVC